MPIDLAYAVGNAVSITTTEKSITVTGGADFVAGVPFARIDIGIYRPFVDFVGTMQKGDEFWIRVYEKIRTGGTARLLFPPAILHGVQTTPWMPPAIELGIGFDISVQRVLGANRNCDWSIRRAY
jgi:hypothetical protein